MGDADSEECLVRLSDDPREDPPSLRLVCRGDEEETADQCQPDMSVTDAVPPDENRATEYCGPTRTYWDGSMSSI